MSHVAKNEGKLARRRIGLDRPAIPLEDYLCAFNRIVTPIWVFDIDRGRVRWANPAALRLWRTESLEELTERDMSQEMSPVVAQRLKQYQQDFKQGAEFEELWTLYPNGVPATFKCMFSGIRLDDGRMAMFCEAPEERPACPETLRSAQALLHTSVMISLYGSDGKALYHNPAARAVHTNSATSLSARFLEASDFDSLHEMLERDGHANLIARINTCHGVRWHEINARRSLDAVTGAPAVLISEVDVSNLKETERKASHLALHDVLTGLPNRTYLMRQIKQLLENAGRSADKRGFLFIDLDHFKTINDSLGHATGDTMLIDVARRLRDCVGSDDTVIRLGGDEFLVVTDTIGDVEQLERTAREIRDALAKPIVVDTHNLQISPSIGITVFPDDGRDIDTLMKHADLAMYEAKDSGRNRYCFFSSHMRERAESRLELESDLRTAVRNRELELFYQPQISLCDAQLVGAEALLRWHHPARGLLRPDAFIKLAEDSGLIEPIGEWVIAQAAAQQKAWQDAGHPISVAVNLSPRQFLSDALIPTIEEIVASSGCDPTKIDFEITESMLMGDNTKVTKALHQLHEMGFNLAVDDFGTGYSNLAYLQRYPISCLKIDKSFIDDLSKTGAITELIISMSKLLDVKIVAEGVETVDQWRWLKDRNCHFCQGYYFSPPVAADQVPRLILEAQQPSETGTMDLYPLPGHV